MYPILFFLAKFESSSEKLFHKIRTLLSELGGWVSVLILSMAAYFAPAFTVFYAMLFIISVDAILGIVVSMKKGSYMTSYLGRETIWKIILYTLFFAAVFAFESALKADSQIGLYFSFALGGVLELLSIAANAAIIKPNFAFFRLIQKYLKSEIARKLGIDESNVSEVLSTKDYANLKSDREKEMIKQSEKGQIINGKPQP